MKLAPDETIVAAIPELRHGPGWSNRPIEVHIVSLQRKSHRVVYIQPDKQTAVMQAMFSTLRAAHYMMLSEVEKQIK